MQIQTGTCQVTNGSANVIANGVDWTDAIVGGLFSVPGPDAALFPIADILEPGDSPSGFWELRLAAPFTGATSTTATYQITVDFTPTLQLPLINRGDVQTGLLFNEAMRKIDEGGGAGGSGGDSEKTVTLAAQTIDVAAGRDYRVTANFSTTASFSTPTFRTRCVASIAGVTVTPEESSRTTTKASWIVSVPETFTGTQVTLTAFLRGTGWASLTVANVPAAWTTLELADETTLTLAAHAVDLVPGVQYRITADFSGVGAFAVPTFKSRMTANLASVVISPEENKRTTGKASWLVFVQGGDYDYDGTPTALLLNATLTGFGWTSATVANVAATWAVEEIGAEGAANQIELRANETHIQWRHVNDEAWTDLIALSELQGPPGADGEDGTEIELRVTETTLQWHYVGGAWVDLFDLSTLGGGGGGAILDPQVFYVRTGGDDANAGTALAPKATGTAAYAAGVLTGIPFALDFGMGSFEILPGDNWNPLCRGIRGRGSQLTTLMIGEKPAANVNAAGTPGKSVGPVVVSFASLTVDTSGGDTHVTDDDSFSAGAAATIELTCGADVILTAKAKGGEDTGSGPGLGITGGGAGANITLNGPFRAGEVNASGGFGDGGRSLAGNITCEGCDLRGSALTAASDFAPGTITVGRCSLDLAIGVDKGGNAFWS